MNFNLIPMSCIPQREDLGGDYVVVYLRLGTTSSTISTSSTYVHMDSFRRLDHSRYLGWLPGNTTSPRWADVLRMNKEHTPATVQSNELPTKRKIRV